MRLGYNINNDIKYVCKHISIYNTYNLFGQ